MSESIEYAYFVYDKNSKHTKIGKTINIQERIATLKIGNPYLRLVYYTDKHSEEYYHNMFINKWVVGEWFIYRI